MSRRAISTVADVALCLLVITAAVATLVLLGHPSDRPDPTTADHAATTLAAGTTAVSYQPAGTDLEQIVAGPIAGLLASVTLANLSIPGEVPPSPPPLERALEPPLESIGREQAIHVATRWQPSDGADLRAGVTIGPRPPETVPVSTAVLIVPSGLPTNASPNRTATAIVDHIVRPAAATRALEEGGRPGRLATERVERFATRAGIDLEQTALEPPVTLDPLVDAFVSTVRDDLQETDQAGIVRVEVSTFP